MQNPQENACTGAFSLTKLHALGWNFIRKEAPAQLFSCEHLFHWTPPDNCFFISLITIYFSENSPFWVQKWTFFRKKPPLAKFANFGPLTKSTKYWLQKIYNFATFPQLRCFIFLLMFWGRLSFEVVKNATVSKFEGVWCKLSKRFLFLQKILNQIFRNKVKKSSRIRQK